MSLSHYIILLPAILTALVAGGLIALGMLSRERRAGALLALFSACMLADMIRTIISRFAPLTPYDFLNLDRAFQAAFQFSLPAGIHLISVLINLQKGRWVYRLLYALAALAVPVCLLTDIFVAGFLPLSSGVVAIPGPGMYGFATISLIAGSIYLPLLARRLAGGAGGNRPERHQMALILGLLGCLLFCFGDLLAGVGLVPWPLSVFCFVPLSAVGLSLLRHDLSPTRERIIGRGAGNDVAFAGLLIGMALAATLIPEAYGDQTAADAWSRLIPNGLPGALSALVCFAVAMAALAKGETSLVTLLFGLVCALWGFYALDLALVASIADPGRALWVSRIDHLLLVMNLPLSFHMCVAGARARVPRWLLAGSYGLAVCTLPLVLTEHYIPTMHTYWFGHFAKAGPAQQIYLAIQVPLIVYGLSLLWRTSRRSRDSKRRNLARYLFTGTLGAFVLTMMAIPATNGVALYPGAQFLFAPFTLMGYGILTTRAMSFRAFLQVGLARFTAAFLVTLVLATALVLLLRTVTGYRLWITILVIALVTAVALEPVIRHLQSWLEGFASKAATGRSDKGFDELCHELAFSDQDPIGLLATALYQQLHAESALVLMGAPKDVRLGGVRIAERTMLPVHVWADDPLIAALKTRTPLHARPEVPAVSAGVIFDLVPDMRLVMPIVLGGVMIGMAAVGPCKNGEVYDAETEHWLEALNERVAPFVQVGIYRNQMSLPEDYGLGELSALDDEPPEDDDLTNEVP